MQLAAIDPDPRPPTRVLRLTGVSKSFAGVHALKSVDFDLLGGEVHALLKLEGDLAPIRRNYLLSGYLADVHSFKLVKSVHVQNGWDPRDLVGETRWLQDLADRDGFPHAIIACADLAAPDAQQGLEAHHAFQNVRGIRQILNWHPDPRFRVASRAGLMDDAAWRWGYGLLKRYDMSFDLQFYWPQMAEAYRLPKAYPDTLMILNHFGMPVDHSASGVASWATALENLAQAPNVMIKLSGFGLGHPGWTIAGTAPLLRRAIDIFGTNRSMFGTNLPVDRLFSATEKIFLAFETVLHAHTRAGQDALLRRNAARAYRIQKHGHSNWHISTSRIDGQVERTSIISGYVQSLGSCSVPLRPVLPACDFLRARTARPSGPAASRRLAAERSIYIEPAAVLEYCPLNSGN